MEKNRELKIASNLADSPAPEDITKGFAMMTRIFSDRKAVREADFGFLDNALFLARKCASHEDKNVRDAVAKMLISVGRMSSQGKSAARETAEEIELQPSEAAKSVASSFYAEMR